MLPMNELKALCEKLGFEQVRTYIRVAVSYLIVRSRRTHSQRSWKMRFGKKGQAILPLLFAPLTSWTRCSKRIRLERRSPLESALSFLSSRPKGFSRRRINLHWRRGQGRHARDLYLLSQRYGPLETQTAKRSRTRDCAKCQHRAEN